jgi:hypothetical protein
MYILLQWQKYSAETVLTKLKYAVPCLIKNHSSGKGRMIVDQKLP